MLNIIILIHSNDKKMSWNDRKNILNVILLY